MSSDYNLYLAIVHVTEPDKQFIRFGHFAGWLLDEDDYQVLAHFGLASEATTDIYDAGRNLAKIEAAKANLTFVDAVSQYGTQPKQSIVDRVKEGIAKSALRQATRQLNNARKALKKAKG